MEIQPFLRYLRRVAHSAKRFEQQMTHWLPIVGMTDTQIVGPQDERKVERRQT